LRRRRRPTSTRRCFVSADWRLRLRHPRDAIANSKTTQDDSISLLESHTDTFFNVEAGERERERGRKRERGDCDRSKGTQRYAARVAILN